MSKPMVVVDEHSWAVGVVVSDSLNPRSQGHRRVIWFGPPVLGSLLRVAHHRIRLSPRRISEVAEVVLGH